MTVEEIREKLKTSEYDFLRNNKHLGRDSSVTELWSDCRRKYRYYDLQL